MPAPRAYHVSEASAGTVIDPSIWEAQHPPCFTARSGPARTRRHEDLLAMVGRFVRPQQDVEVVQATHPPLASNATADLDGPPSPHQRRCPRPWFGAAIGEQFMAVWLKSRYRYPPAGHQRREGASHTVVTRPTWSAPVFQRYALKAHENAW